MGKHSYQHDKTFVMESGDKLEGLHIAYHTWGKLSAKKDNVIWVCHAFTANSDVEDWWPGMLGKQSFFNPDTHFIVCANILGSCYGTTGPLSVNAATGKPYFRGFPKLTVRDMVNAHRVLAEHLGIKSIQLLAGASVGGHQALEWAVMQPATIQHLILLETSAEFTPWGRAFNASQQMAIEADPSFYQDSESGGLEGMKVARSIALLSYRNALAYNRTQHEASDDITDGYRAHSYQRYQGEKLAKRFNAYSYYYLSKALDSHHIGRGRGSVEEVLQSITARTLIVAVKSDILFSLEEQQLMLECIPDAQMEIIDSDYGHDGFLLEAETLTRIFSEFIRN